MMSPRIGDEWAQDQLAVGKVLVRMASSGLLEPLGRLGDCRRENSSDAPR